MGSAASISESAGRDMSNFKSTYIVVAYFFMWCARFQVPLIAQTTRPSNDEIVKAANGRSDDDSSDFRTGNLTSNVNILAEVESSLAAPERIDPRRNIFPAVPLSKRLSEDFRFFDQEGGEAPLAVSIGEPDDIDPGGNSDFSPHALPDSQYFVYSLSKVPPERKDVTLLRLTALRHTPLYGFYFLIPRAEVSKHSFDVQFYMQMEHLEPKDLPGLNMVPAFRCRYSREIDLSDGHLNADGLYKCGSGTFAFPSTWRPVLAGEKPLRMWCECAVQVDIRGIPIDAPLRHIRPIALQTNASLFLVNQTVRMVNAKHGYMVEFTNAAFNLSTDGPPITALEVAILMSKYHANLTQVFSDGQLGADEDSDAPPGEFHYRREYQPSNVLKGFAGPYKELSYYNVRWWRASDEELYTVAPVHKGGDGATGDSIFVQVSHSLTISVGASDDYAEPTDQQVATYQQVVSKTMKEALVDTAGLFSGKVDGTGYDIDVTKIDATTRASP